jgi:phosphohistidine phosphatase
VAGQAQGTDETTRRLTLLRHAKSDWPDVPDHDRPLAKRGRKDAPRIGRWLRTHGYVPDVVICSTALRTRQTWDLVAPELSGSAQVLLEPRAYAASPLTLLYLCRELPDPCRAALLIAHNPGLEELAASLSGAQAQAGPRFPTAAVAVFEFTGAWSDLAPGEANLLEFTIPADLLPVGLSGQPVSRLTGRLRLAGADGRATGVPSSAGLFRRGLRRAIGAGGQEDGDEPHGQRRRGDHRDQGQLPGGQRGVRVRHDGFLLC